MSVRHLAEAAILQSIEDLWDPVHFERSKDFFNGDAFDLCSELAGLDRINKFGLIHLLERCDHNKFSKQLGA